MSNVRDFGAIGDGVADDTQAIEHAIANHDGVIEFPKGEYRLTRTVTVHLDQVGPISFEGTGSSARILMTGAGPAIRVLGTHAGTADPKGVTTAIWARERCPVFGQLEILGSHPEADGLELVGCWQPNLVGLSIHDVRHAVRLHQRNRNVIIDRCHIYHNTGIGVFLDQVNLHQINITGSHISYNRQGGIRIVESEVRNLQITGNDIEYNNAASHPPKDGEPETSTAEIYLDCGRGGSMREITISGNTIQSTASPGGANLRFEAAPDVNHRIGMLTITGNLVGSQETNIQATRCRGLVISGNYIYGAESRNLSFQECENVGLSGNCIGANPDYQVPVRQVGLRFRSCQGVNLSGEMIESMPPVDPQQVSSRLQPAEGILEILQCRDVLVSGCQFVDARPTAVYVEESSHVLVQSCQATDRRPETTRDWTVIWSGKGELNSLKHCLLASGNVGAVQADPESNVSQEGNLIVE